MKAGVVTKQVATDTAGGDSGRVRAATTAAQDVGWSFVAAAEAPAEAARGAAAGEDAGAVVCFAGGVLGVAGGVAGGAALGIAP